MKEQCVKIANPLQIHVGLCIGEFGVGKNIDHVRNIEILIGCPGRLAHFVRSEIVRLDECRFVVMDEVDKLCENLDKQESFFNDLTNIFEKVPEFAQHLYFTATYKDQMDVWLQLRKKQVIHIQNLKKRIVSKAIFKPVFVKKDAIRTYFIREYIKKYCNEGLVYFFIVLLY